MLFRSVFRVMSIANIPQLTLESASPRDHEMLKKLTTMAASLEHGGGQMLPDPSGYLFWQLDCSPSKLAEAFEISFRDFNGRRSLEHRIATLTALKLVSHEATGPLDCGPAIRASKCYQDEQGIGWIGYRLLISCLLDHRAWPS